MDKKTVQVNICGATATGKSSLMWAFIKMLQEHGFETEMESMDYKSIHHLHMSMEHDITLEQRMAYLKDKIKVKVVEVQTINPLKNE